MKIDVARLAEEAGLAFESKGELFTALREDCDCRPALERFANAVLEEAAKVALAEIEERSFMFPSKLTDPPSAGALMSAAEAIRALKVPLPVLP